MPTIFLWIFVAYKLLNTLVLFLIPKKLRAFLPSSWYSYSRQNQPPASEQQSKKKDHISASPRRLETDELNRVFQLFDKNGDGRITKKELNDSLETMGIWIPDRELERMIEKIDVNLDGCVDVDEFGNLYRTIVDERSEEEDMREAFNVFDQNGDGFISVDELKSMLGSLGLKQGRNAEDCRKMIGKVDLDGDGMVDFAEFKNMMKGN